MEHAQRLIIMAMLGGVLFIQYEQGLHIEEIRKNISSIEYDVDKLDNKALLLLGRQPDGETVHQTFRGVVRLLDRFRDLRDDTLEHFIKNDFNWDRY